jgi:hypothetical protein
MILTERDCSIRKKNLSQSHLIHHKCHMNWPGIEHGPPQWHSTEKYSYMVYPFTYLSVIPKVPDLFTIAPTNHKIQVSFHTWQPVIWIGDHGHFLKCQKWKKNIIICPRPSYQSFWVMANLFLADSILFQIWRPIICDIKLRKQIQNSALTFGLNPQSAVERRH